MYKLLLIEDYPVISVMYAKVLKENGFSVDTVQDGEQALEKVKQTNYDIILLDMLLPKVNGMEFLKKFKDHGKTKVVALSDFDYKETVKQAFELGIDKFWLKVDNTPHVLVKKLEVLLKEPSERHDNLLAQ